MNDFQSTSHAAIHYLVDASIYIFQSHFSPNVHCLDRDGNELSAVYGYTQFLLQFLRRMKPSSVAVAMDDSLFTGFRHDISADYKSNRELPDENLAMQLQACKDISLLLGLATYSSKRYEADDIIGTLSHSIREQSSAGCAIHILSKDKDLAQLLVNEHDCLWDFSGNKRRFSPDIFNEFGVLPKQIPDYLGLVGDAVDCIRGVPGMGPVKAKVLMSHFKHLDGIYENLNLLADLPLRGAAKLNELLQAHREEAFQCRTLATIVTDAQDETFSNRTLDDISPAMQPKNNFEEFFRTYRFRDQDVHQLSAQIENLAKYWVI